MFTGLGNYTILFLSGKIVTFNFHLHLPRVFLSFVVVQQTLLRSLISLSLGPVVGNCIFVSCNRIVLGYTELLVKMCYVTALRFRK
jgi:hypothetical protein